MRLVEDWKQIIARAWSVRLMILAGVLSGVEVALPLFVDVVPRGVFAVLSALLSIAALCARVSVQKNLK